MAWSLLVHSPILQLCFAIKPFHWSRLWSQASIVTTVQGTQPKSLSSALPLPPADSLGPLAWKVPAKFSSVSEQTSSLDQPPLIALIAARSTHCVCMQA